WSAGLYSDSQYFYEVILAVSVLVYGLLTFILRSRGRSFSTHLSIATLGLFLLLIARLDAGQLSRAMVVEGPIADLLGHALKSKLQQFTGGAVLLIGAITTLTWPIDKVWSEHTLAWIVLMAAILALYGWVRRLPADSGYKQVQNALLWIDAALLLVF